MMIPAVLIFLGGLYLFGCYFFFLLTLTNDARTYPGWVEDFWFTILCWPAVVLQRLLWVGK